MEEFGDSVSALLFTMFLKLKRQYSEIIFNEDLLLMLHEVRGNKKMIPC